MVKGKDQMEELDSFLNELPLPNALKAEVNSPSSFLGGDFKFDTEDDIISSSIDNSSNIDPRKRKQLERNRETAKRCRRRKREKVDALMEEVVRLRETNKELEIQLKVAKSKLGETTSGRGNRGVAEEKRRLAEMKRIGQMIDQRCSEEEISNRLKAFSDLYSDFGRERRTVVKTQISQLEAILLPTKISKMLLWFLEQDDSFFRNGTVWSTLLEEMKIDSKQKEMFLSQRSKLGKQNDGFQSMIQKLKSLEKEILTNMKARAMQMAEVTNIFTPIQQAKFLHWVENNEACVQLLDTLWKKRTKTEEASQK